MGDHGLREAIEEELAKGPLRASVLASRVAESQAGSDNLTEDLIRAEIWDLVENNQILWKPDGRLAQRERQHAR